MPQLFVDVLRGEFFTGAMPEAVFWGRIALGVGLAGLAASILLALANFRDRLSLERGNDDPATYRPPKWGPLSYSLGDFFEDPTHTAPLSPDAAAEYIIGRLEAARDLTQSGIRYFSYAPLLCGLMGTIFALRTLLVVQGNTLQQIQPHLAGVFAGTMAGILGSLIAAIGALMLDWTSLSTVNRAQNFVHRHIIPTLPERRIAVRIEDAILAMIAEKAQAVADNFKTSIAPVAMQMEKIAERCGESADLATKALSEATKAVREAGDLQIASRNFKSGAHMIDSSAEQLSDATKQTAEVILRVGEIRQSLTDLLNRIGQATESLSATSNRLSSELTSRIAELHAQGETLRTSVASLGPAVQTLITELNRRAESDAAHLELIRGHVQTTTNSVTSIAGLLKESSDQLKNAPAHMRMITETLADGIQQELAEGMNGIGDNLSKRLDSVIAALERSTAAFTNQLNSGSNGNGVANSAELIDTIHEAVRQLTNASEQSSKLAEALQSQREVTGKKRDGFFRRLWE